MKKVLILANLVCLAAACQEKSATGIIVRKRVVPIQGVPSIYEIDVAKGKDTLREIRMTKQQWLSCELGDTLNLTD